jgi:1,4-alpha-glucan branching enzyme
VRNGVLLADPKPWDGQPGSLSLTLPPLGVVWLAPVDAPKKLPAAP